MYGDDAEGRGAVPAARRRLDPVQSVGVKDGTAADSLDCRDMDGNPLYEPAPGLGFVGPPLAVDSR